MQAPIGRALPELSGWQPIAACAPDVLMQPTHRIVTPAERRPAGMKKAGMRAGLFWTQG
jgi:hypothetical protein